MAAPEQAAHARGGGGAEASEVRDYWRLLKPNVMSLVVFSAAAGLYLAPGHLHPVLACVAILCIAVAAGAAAAINNGYDADIDRLMARTRRRPTACGRIGAEDALAFGVTLALISVMVMGLAVNWVGGRAAGADDRVLRLRLHALAQAAHAAEHRDRRGRRRVPADGRLGRGDRRGEPRLDRPVPDHLLLDAAALLGAGALPLQRLRAGRRADAAGGRRAREDPPARAGLHRGARAGEPAPVRARPGRARSTAWPRWRSAAAS